MLLSNKYCSENQEFMFFSSKNFSETVGRPKNINCAQDTCAYEKYEHDYRRLSCFKAKVLKAFKIASDCHTKIC